jgi:hypothetical protein
LIIGGRPVATVINDSGYVITTPGEYILGRNLIHAGSLGAAIRIEASNVKLNLNGFSIIGGGSASSRALGIAAENQTGIEVFGGTISGFMYGVALADSTVGLTYGRHSIHDLTVTDCTFRGIRVEGPNSVVRDCIIFDISGTTVFANAFACGIESFGPCRATASAP